MNDLFEIVRELTKKRHPNMHLARLSRMLTILPEGGNKWSVSGPFWLSCERKQTQRMFIGIGWEWEEIFPWDERPRRPVNKKTAMVLSNVVSYHARRKILIEDKCWRWRRRSVAKIKSKVPDVPAEKTPVS